MTTIAHNPIENMLTEEFTGIRKNWGWFLAFGIVQIIVGILAISFAFSATIVSVVMLGVLLLIAAGVQIAAAILARNWSGFFLFLLLGRLRPCYR
jgi:uncharacterized membrane protein HdeD (DUF308 family)